MFEILGQDFYTAFDENSFRWRVTSVEIKKKWLRKMAELATPPMRKFIEGKNPVVKPRGFRTMDDGYYRTKEWMLDNLERYFENWITGQAVRTTLNIPPNFVYHSCVNCGREQQYGLFTALGDEKIHRTFYFDMDDPESRHEFLERTEYPEAALSIVGLCRQCNTPCRVCAAKIPTKYVHKTMQRWFRHRTCPTCLGVLPTMFEFPKVTMGEWRKLSERRK